MNDHIPDVTKMISDTPRTDEAQYGTGRVSVDFARILERELNAANERIKRLEEAGDRLQMLIEEQGWWESVPQEMWRKAKDAK